jgi:hypothetical protein
VRPDGLEGERAVVESGSTDRAVSLHPYVTTPSNAGPAALAARFAFAATTTSVFVPTSTSILTVSGDAVEAERDEVRRDVGADVARDERRRPDAAARVHVEPDLERPGLERGRRPRALDQLVLRERSVGPLADRRDVQPEEEVAHGRVADDDGLYTSRRLTPRRA